MNCISKARAFYVALLLTLPVAATAHHSTELTSEKEGVSYFIGINMVRAQRFGEYTRGLDIDFEALRLGVEDAFGDFPSAGLRDTAKLSRFEVAVENGQSGRLFPRDALPPMRAASAALVYVPPELAYGVQGIPDLIGPDELVAFPVNLDGTD